MVKERSNVLTMMVRCVGESPSQRWKGRKKKKHSKVSISIITMAKKRNNVPTMMDAIRRGISISTVERKKEKKNTLHHVDGKKEMQTKNKSPCLQSNIVERGFHRCGGPRVLITSELEPVRTG
jgi:hypothetical protein